MSESRISPVVQFLLLIVPTVMTGFYLVYSMTGLILDEREKYIWSLEAQSVATAVGGSIVLYSALVLLYARSRGCRGYHLLNLSGWGHLILAAVLTLAVYIMVRI